MPKKISVARTEMQERIDHAQEERNKCVVGSQKYKEYSARIAELIKELSEVKMTTLDKRILALKEQIKDIDEERIRLMKNLRILESKKLKEL